MSVGQILDTSLKIFTRHWWTFIRIVLYIVAPLELVNALIAASAFDIDEGATGEGDLAIVIGAIVVVLVIAIAEYVISSGATFRAVSEAYLGRIPEWSSSTRYALRRMLPILWVTVLTGLATLLGLIALIIGAVFLYVALSVAVPVLVGEDVRGVAALKRSYHLVKGRWWPTFGLLLLATLLVGIIGAVAGGILFVLLDAGIDTTSFGGGLFVDAIVNIVIGVITTPFLSAVTVVLYYDLRVRKEGLDIELLAAQLDDEPGPTGA